MFGDSGPVLIGIVVLGLVVVLIITRQWRLRRTSVYIDSVHNEKETMSTSPQNAAPVEGVPPWARASLVRWLVPVLNAVQKRQYIAFTTRPGIPSTEFLLLAERRLHLTLKWGLGEQAALDDLGNQIAANGELFLQVIELALEHIDLGYSFQEQDAALAELDRILTEAGSVWRVDIQQVESGPEWHGHKGYRVIRKLQRRTSPEVVNALQAMGQSARTAAPHLTSAWNHAFGRNPNPTQAYSEAIKAVEAAAIPIVSPNDRTATLGKVLGQLRSTPQKWQVVLSEGAAP